MFQNAFPIWSDSDAAEMSEPELLRYRSNLLGSDLRITNFGGGNTSAKVEETDPLTGEKVTVLWVKGSGGDLGSMGLDGFSTLYLDKLEALKGKYRGLEHEDEMVGYLPHCTFNLNPRAASIDTPIHAFIPYPHVDHVHPDEIIAIATMSRGMEITKDVFGGAIGWLDWQRPGFDLGLQCEALAKSNPEMKGLILGGHGLVTWGATAKSCYETTINVLEQAQKWFQSRQSAEPFGGQIVEPLRETDRLKVAARLAPILRGKVSKHVSKVGHFVDSSTVLDFVCSDRAAELAALGTSCPDHFLRTKRQPLLLDAPTTAEKLDEVVASLDEKLDAYAAEYKAYYERCKRSNSPAMRDPYPVVILIPGVGMLCFAKDKATARIASEFYVNAVNVMRGAETVDSYAALPEQESFDIEYWLLEEAKLQRMPKPKPMAGKIVYITGAAGGIGQACARKMLDEGACVVLTDVDERRLGEASLKLVDEFGRDVVRSYQTDVTKETSVSESVAFAAVEFGGVDVVVSNAGIATAAPFDETSLDLWTKNHAVMTTGYFLVAREGFRVLKRQGVGGSIVFVASKNGLSASPNAAAYCTAKAAEIQLARCIALDGAPYGIRANVVNPDAVLSGSHLWSGPWAEERAAAYNIKVDELPEYYRNRSLLKRSVLPEDIAEAIYFLSSDAASKSTGNVFNVDAGNAAAFPR